MGGSSKQVVGYKYFTGLMVAIGNTIEQVININPDNRGWILSDRIYQDILKDGDVSLGIAMPNIFGGDKQEGGWLGMIEIHTGRPEYIRQNEYLAEHDSDHVSSFPCLSYVVFKGYTVDKGFQIVSMSGMMKEVLYRVKRTRIKNDGSVQWYKSRGDGAVVCEIDAKTVDPSCFDYPDVEFDTTYSLYAKRTGSEPIKNTYNTHHSPNTDLFIYNGGKMNTGNGYITFGDSSMLNESIEAKTEIDVNFYGIVKIDIIYGRLAGNESSIKLIFTGGNRLISNDIVYTQTDSISNKDRYVSGSVTFACFNSGKIGFNFLASGAVPRNQINNIVAAEYFFEARYSILNSCGQNDVIGIDINPIHKIREILTDDTAMNKPESDVNDGNFMFAADRIWDEGLGISWAIQEKSCKEAIDELLYHIEAGIRVNRQTGQYEIVLFRDDLLNLDDAMQFDESNIKNFSREVANQDDLTNVLNVKYYDRANIKESSFNVYENGNLMSNGNQEITEAVNFPYFMNRRNAELVANWKLKQLSTPTWKGSFTTGKYEARKLNKYDVIKLSWINADFVDMPVRIMKIGLGDGRDNTVSIDWVEVIPYSSLSYQSINVDPPTSVVLPAQPNMSKVFEIPYFEAVQNFGQTQVDAEIANNPDLGYLMIASKRPQNNSLNALLYTNSGTGYIQQNVINYCPTLTLDQNIDYLDTSFAVKNVDSISNAELGSCLIIDNEIMVYQSFNAETKAITVKRGALDTIPAKHNLNANAFFYDKYPSYDLTQYVDGEVVDAKSLTTTPSSILSIGDADTLPLEINARAIRPYPPANIKINNSYYLAESPIADDLVISWVDRNRLQQTGGAILGWTDATVTKEAGVTYSVEISESGTILNSQTGITSNTCTISNSVLLVNKTHKLNVWSVRDGYESFQIFEHQIFITAPDVPLTTMLYKDHITGSTVQAAAVTAVVDETLSANMKWDGTSISGKAEAGATITIEVQE